MPHQNNTIWKPLYSTKEAIQKTRTSENINSTKKSKVLQLQYCTFWKVPNYLLCHQSQPENLSSIFGVLLSLSKNLGEKTIVINVQRSSFKWFVSCFVDLLNDEPLLCFIIIYFLPFFCLLLSQLQAGGRFLDQLERTGSRNWNNRTALREPKVHQIPHFSQRSMERRQYFQLQASRNSSILDTS